VETPHGIGYGPMMVTVDDKRPERDSVSAAFERAAQESRWSRQPKPPTPASVLEPQWFNRVVAALARLLRRL
jgi:hypothetical protein